MSVYFLPLRNTCYCCEFCQDEVVGNWYSCHPFPTLNVILKVDHLAEVLSQSFLLAKNVCCGFGVVCVASAHQCWGAPALRSPHPNLDLSPASRVACASVPAMCKCPKAGSPSAGKKEESVLTSPVAPQLDSVHLHVFLLLSF